MIFIAWTKPIQSPMLCRLKTLFLDLSAKMYETYEDGQFFKDLHPDFEAFLPFPITTFPYRPWNILQLHSTSPAAGNPDSHHRGCSSEGPEDQGSLLALGEDTGAR